MYFVRELTSQVKYDIQPRSQAITVDPGNTQFHITIMSHTVQTTHCTQHEIET